MTYEQIIKALERLHQHILQSKLAEQITESEILGVVEALALIKRQREEKEEILGTLKNLTYDYRELEASVKFHKAEIRAEAIREFAERIKAQSYESIDWSHGEHPLVCEFEIVEEIAEEMTEEQK